MASPPLSITVAIPTYNGQAHLAATLESILTQEGPPFNVLICDDHSDDHTVEMVRALAGDRASVIVNDRRLGLAGNWNQCVAHCQTPLIAIVHQDDVLAPGHLASHLATFASDDRIGLVSSASTVIDEHGWDVPPNIVDRGGLGPVDRIFQPGEALGALAAGNPLRCSAVSIRVLAHHDAGGFDPSFHYVLDWDFWIRVSRRWKVAWLAAPSVQVRWHAASETHRFKRGRTDLDETHAVLDRLLKDDLAARPELCKEAKSRLARAFLNRAHDTLHAGQIDLARECLGEALRLSPRVLRVILADPRLAVQMASLRIAPRLARRWFAARS